MRTISFHWIIFFLITFFLLVFDLKFIHTKNKKISFKKNVFISLFYIIISLLFSVYIYFTDGILDAKVFLTAYIVEKTLSLDNIFVIALIFSYFKIPEAFQQRVLFWGILSAIVLRGILISIGATMVERFSWMLYIFSAILIFTGIKMLSTKNSTHDISKSWFLKQLKKVISVTDQIHGERFFIYENNPTTKKILFKNYTATPLFLSLFMIEIADLVFAIDSIPAIFSITTNSFIVYTSNIFAILGLRSLYFVLQKMIEHFSYLKYALAALLIFIGSKIFIKEFLPFIEIDATYTLIITLFIIIAGIIPTYLNKRKF